MRHAAEEHPNEVAIPEIKSIFHLVKFVLSIELDIRKKKIFPNEYSKGRSCSFK